MRILHLGKYYPPHMGGMEVFLRDLAEEQARQGSEVCVLAHAQGALAGSDERREGVRLVLAPSLGELAHAPISPAYPLRLRELLRSWRPDVIHAHLPNSSVFWPLASRGSRPPLVLHWHADVDAAMGDWRLRRLYPLYSRAEALLLRRAARVVATSPQALQASSALRPFAHACSVVPLGRRDPTAALPHPPQQDACPCILSVGRFARYKRFHALVQAFALLLQRWPQARLTIAGHGPQLQELRKLVRRLGLEGRVSLPGRLDDTALQELYARSWLFCLPSSERTEAFGLVLLEAMAWSRPLVTTPIAGSGVLWLNRHRQTGLVAQDDRPESLAAAMGLLLENPDLRRDLGSSGRRFFESRCHIAAVARSIQEVYHQAGAPRSHAAQERRQA